MNSCFYKAQVMHRRLEPKKHKFVHTIFIFYLDLDEIDNICEKSRWISRNRFNLHSFYDKDHLEIGGKDVKENILKYVKEKGVFGDIHKIMLVTSIRAFGYVFNPVSFYFCLDSKGEVICIVPEVSNTFREMKPYFIGKDALLDGRFISRQKKHFYVSPFMDLDNEFEFNVSVPDDRLSIRVDALKNQKKIFYASITGKKVELTDKNVLKYNMCYPWVTLKIIFLIHMHGLILLLKKVPFHFKHENPELQKDVTKRWREKENKNEGKS